MDALTERLNHLMQNERFHSKKYELLQESVTFLQKKKKEIIKILIETDTVALDTVSRKNTSSIMGNEENVIAIDNDNELFFAALPNRSLEAPAKENTGLKEHQHETQECLSPTKRNNNETQHKNENNFNQKKLYIGLKT